ncbi:hypothetical protein [Natronobacterium gregoryi]|uniref:Uncharacterized protein n=2 Tax=Natronobacterium gregoryi TaxID=44930 RepID=L0AN82_NATGS|nr:hypothetical protein [Natronobacterium gregoryi]AFZ74642.1 hypothetical protein Natgr_3524 [Natronobacterium gregoryi SP2]ELY72540.1 hypothetical protein C490_03088 [Natronobacterium gregoryi SP2]PLK19824.1 hypothetical protein CYV19_13025 [Natronobacterium gregoryi SP2]SFJ31137.1 hypothetical protein SAMN05443661_12161 [Natronobacterium gregoryi]
MFRILKILVGVVVLLLVAGLLMGLVSVEVSAQEQEDEEVNEVQNYEFEFSDSVRLVEYRETDDGEVEAVIESDRAGVSGSYADDGTSGGGALPPVEDMRLEQGENVVTVDVEEDPVVTFTIDSSRYMTDDLSDPPIRGPPSGDEWSPVYIVSGIVFSFGSIVASGLLLFSFIDKITGGKKVFGK